MTGDMSKQYGFLKPIERFRLVIAADERSDDPDLDKLKKSGERLQYLTSDDFPYTHAFVALAHLHFMEMVEEAAIYRDFQEHAFRSIDKVDENIDEKADADPFENELSLSDPWCAMLFAGYLFRTKYLGWVRFCKGLGVPPYSLWRKYPGFERLETTFKLSKKKAYVRKRFARVVLRRQEITADELARCPLTPKTIAKELRGMYRDMVSRGGS